MVEVLVALAVEWVVVEEAKAVQTAAALRMPRQ